MFRKAMITSFLMAACTAAQAETFNPASYLPDARIETLTRVAANQLVERDLFDAPYATVVVGNVDLYENFPYLEAHYFQVVSDPGWGRLLYGEIERGLSAFDGSGSVFGPLAAPRGMSTDGQGRVFVADTGNDRVLVFQTVSEFDRVALEPLFSIDDLEEPYDVAFSDAGTPRESGDDLLYVANSGRNEVVRYTLGAERAERTAVIGELGSGSGRFAGPLALSVGHADGAHTGDVYVADAHNGRIVHLRDDGGNLAWAGERGHDLGLVTSLETDHWGNIYATAPRGGSLVKYTGDLQPVADLKSATTRPRSFHVPFVNVHDHRAGTVSRTGQGRGILVEEWGNQSGLRLLGLGVDVKDASVIPGDDIAVALTLTDHAAVVAEIVDPASGRTVARHTVEQLGAGRRTVSFAPKDRLESWTAGRYRLDLRATSTYDGSVAVQKSLDIDLAADGGPMLPARLTLLGNAPNPFNPATTISFMVPTGPDVVHSLQIYDTRGRLVRRLGSGPLASGRHEAVWNGRDDQGGVVGAGVYLYQLVVGADKLTGKMVLVK